MKQKKYENLKKIKPFYKPYKWFFVGFIFFTAMAGAMLLLYPYLASEITLILTSGNLEKLAFTALLLFGLTVLHYCLAYLADWFYILASGYLIRDIRQSVVSRIMNLKLQTLYEAGAGYFQERLNEDSNELGTIQLDVYKQIITLIINLGFVGYLTVLNWQIGLLFGVGILLIVLLEQLRIRKMIVNKRMTKFLREQQRNTESQILKGIKEIKGLNAKEIILNRHTEKNNKTIDMRKKRELIDKSLRKTVETTKGLFDLILLLLAGLYLIPTKQIELLAVLVVYNYRTNVYDLVSGLAHIKDYYVNGELAASRLNAILAPEVSKIDRFGDYELTEPVEEVQFKDVMFEYVPGKPVLKDIDFIVKKNSLVGFVGKSGSGKSTIFNLLLNFNHETAGEITINNINLHNFSEKSLRSVISIVLQEPYIFNDTVMENIRIAKPDATDEQIIDACKGAEIHDEIMEMPQGYESLIGDNGNNLSGGQKQRLEIARALLKDSDIILFDEATSALDKNNVSKINKLLVKLSKSKIVFVIAHRLAIMRECDEVFVLQDGVMVAHGPHKELIENSEYYAELFRRNEQQKPEEKQA